MKSWRTTVSAVATAAFGFILFSPQYFHAVPWLVDIAKYATLGGMIAFGINSKDVQVHSTEGQVMLATAEKNQAIREAVNNGK